MTKMQYDSPDEMLANIVAEGQQQIQIIYVSAFVTLCILEKRYY